tara:strand:+ start:110 stop:943 length:834 start_codon:yes stop_codon:yes gene_type:complete
MFCFGSAYPIGKIGTNNIPPILFSSLRVLFILIVMLPFFKFKLPKKNLIIPLLFFSLTMGIGVYVPLYFALNISSLVNPIIIGTQLTVPFGLILGLIFLKEKIVLKKWIFIFFAFLGIIIISYDPRIEKELIALIIISLMAFFYALSNMLSRSLKEIDTITQISWHSFISIFPLFFMSYIFEGNPVELLFPISISSIFTIIHASIIVSIIGHGSMFYLYKFYPIQIILPFYSLFPVFGIILTFFIFLELPNMFEYIGGILVIASIFFIHLENLKNKN